MKRGGTGGGNTTTGLDFEEKVSLQKALAKVPGYKVIEDRYIEYHGEKVGEIYKKHAFYSTFLKSQGLEREEILSKKLLPDNAVRVYIRNTIFIVEIKYQEVAGSTDEKLQTCDFKRKQYSRLLKPLDMRVEYCYILNDWFLDKRYVDTLNYIQSCGCYYFFNHLPLEFLGLPLPNDTDEKTK